MVMTWILVSWTSLLIERRRDIEGIGDQPTHYMHNHNTVTHAYSYSGVSSNPVRSIPSKYIQALWSRP